MKIPEGTEEISLNAFSNCSSLIRVELPMSVEYISYNAFDGCNSALEFIVPEGSYAEEYVKRYHTEQNISFVKR